MREVFRIGHGGAFHLSGDTLEQHVALLEAQSRLPMDPELVAAFSATGISVVQHPFTE